MRQIGRNVMKSGRQGRNLGALEGKSPQGFSSA